MAAPREPIEPTSWSDVIYAWKQGLIVTEEARALLGVGHGQVVITQNELSEGAREILRMAASGATIWAPIKLMGGSSAAGPMERGELWPAPFVELFSRGLIEPDGPESRYFRISAEGQAVIAGGGRAQ